MTTPAPIQEREQQIVDDFSLFDDWMDKYAYLIDLGKALPGLETRYKTEPYRVKGCQSNVWLRAWSEDDRVRYQADSDAMITRGLVALLMRVLDDQKAPHVAGAELTFIDEIGLRDHLSTNRSNGLTAMVGKMKSFATALMDEKTTAA